MPPDSGKKRVKWPILLARGQGEDDSPVPVQSQAQVAIHLGERGLFVLVIEGDVVKRTALHPIRSSGSDRVIFEGDQEDR